MKLGATKLTKNAAELGYARFLYGARQNTVIEHTFYRLSLKHLHHFPPPIDDTLRDIIVQWMKDSAGLDAVIEQVRHAFANVKLEDGIGLIEAQGLDDYLSGDALAEFRVCDERDDWQRISVDTLNACESSPCFMDAKGLRFILPALLIASLNDQYYHGPLTYPLHRMPVELVSILTVKQKSAIVAFLELTKKHPFLDAQQVAEIDDMIADVQYT